MNGPESAARDTGNDPALLRLDSGSRAAVIGGTTREIPA